jgi:hypothetical protein
MSFTYHLTAGLTLVACSIPALAQDPPEGARAAGRQRMVAPLMQALDADQDGALSPAEIENAAKALAKLDKNGDGTLSNDELRPAGLPSVGGRPAGDAGSPETPRRPGQPGGNGQASGEMLSRLFETRDADKDGKLSGDEIPERMRQNLERVDANKDGSVDRTEMQQAMSRMQQAGGRPGGRPGAERRAPGGEGGEGRRPARPDGE